MLNGRHLDVFIGEFVVEADGDGEGVEFPDVVAVGVGLNVGGMYFRLRSRDWSRLAGSRTASRGIRRTARYRRRIRTPAASQWGELRTAYP